MGILSEAKLSFSNRRITENFLKTHHFHKDRWGGPEDRKKPTSIFYEALYSCDIGIFPYSDEEHSVTATIMYFPEDFDGYTTIGNICDNWGRGNVAGKLVITYENDRTFEYTDERGWTDTLIFDCKTHANFHDIITIFNDDLIKKDYEPIKF
jgi:hypothetical protein